MRQGGFGIPCLRTSIPYKRSKRIARLANSTSEVCREAAQLEYLKQTKQQADKLCLYNGTLIDSLKAHNSYWTSSLYNSNDGSPLQGASSAPSSSAWISEGTRLLRGHTFIDAVKVRYNAMPNLTHKKRGQGVPKECRAGCKTSETLTHILQKCPRTYGARIHRHNALATYLAGGLRKRGYQVLEEPIYATSLGDRKPDLVIIRDEQVMVLDVQVVGGGISLSQAHQSKVAKYMMHEIVNQIAKEYNCTPIVTSLTLSYRGVWAEESVKSLKMLGCSNQDIKILTVRCLEGSIRCFRVHQRMTCTIVR